MQASNLPFLSEEEITRLCEPLTRPAAQCRYLTNQLKLSVHRKPSGRPLVARSEFERVLGAARFATQNTEQRAGPNVVGMLAHLEQRKNGKKS